MELLEEADVEHVVQTGARRQGKTNRDVVDELGDTVGPMKCGCSLPATDWGREATGR
jgi:hypothetical protein